MSKSISRTIDMFRGYIKQNSDDSVYSDSYLYDVLLSVRNELFRKSLNNNTVINNNMWKTICIAVCPSDFIPCDCISVSHPYTVLKSKQKIPNYITSNSYKYIQLRTVDNSKIIPYKTIAQGKLMKYKKGSSKMWFTIIDEYLYVVNHPTNAVKVLMLSIILEDPRDAALISYCDTEGNVLERNCYDSSIDTFSIMPHLENPLMMQALQQLGITLQLPDDMSNNTESAPNKY